MIKERKVFKIALSIIAAGAVLLGCGYVFGGYKNIYGNSRGFNINKSKEIVNEKHSLDSFSNISFDVAYGDVEIEKGSEYAIETIYDKSLGDISYTISDDTLTVVENSKNKVSFNISFFDNNNENSNTRIKIYVPDSSEILQLKSQMSCGDMSIKGLKFKDGNITCDYGDVILKDIECSNFTICNESGDIDLSNIKGTDIVTNSEYGNVKISNLGVDSLSCNSESGDIDFSNVKFESGSISDSYGSIKGDTIVGNGLKVKNECGDINISGELKGENTVNLEYGSAKVETSLSEKEYSYDLSTEFGSCTVNGKEKNNGYAKTSESSKNNIKAVSKNGDINIKFAG